MFFGEKPYVSNVSVFGRDACSTPAASTKLLPGKLVFSGFFVFKTPQKMFWVGVINSKNLKSEGIL